MENKTDIQKRVSMYQLTFPAEDAGLTSLIQFLHHTSDDQLFDRKNFDGHLTASAFIYNAELSALLLINHKKLNRWLQPGGHIDVEDVSIVAAALREATEETGLASELLTEMSVTGKGSIFDIDSHIIPSNINKNEPEHTHHDLRFLFSCPANSSMELKADEATAFVWKPLHELTHDETFGRVAAKILALVNLPPVDVISGKLV